MGMYEISLVALYLAVTAYLGYLGYKHTRTTADYLLAGREMHPVIMALSYGSTFISTSAIVGFGGVAATFGLGLLWLVFLNIFVGIFIAFVFLGEPTRRIAHRLGAHTFPEFLGRRFESRLIHFIAGLIIFLFMPLYTTAVLLGGAEFLQVMFHITDFNVAILILAFVIAAYVLAGGLKGVMYTDALQAGVMVTGMVILIVLTYVKLGGVTQAHEALAALTPEVPDKLKAIGHRGWTSFPAFGWGDTRFNVWWLMVSTIILGVGIGVLAQPQLIVRFMTVKSKRELNRAVAVGAVFILLLPGVVYTVGGLSNVYFRNVEEIRGTIVAQDEQAKTVRILPEGMKPGAELTIPLGPASEVILGTDGEADIVRPRLISIARTEGKGDQIIPTYISRAMPRWFGIIFLLTLLSAAMSTLSGQLHAMGTALGRDVVGQLMGDRRLSDRTTIRLVRVSIVIGLTASILLGAKSLRDYIAVATALFFGLCAASFLPSFLGALFWRRMTRAGATASIVGGFMACGFWMLFGFEKTAKGIGLCQYLTGQPVLFAGPNWPSVDPLMVALPVSAFLAVAVSLMTAPPSTSHLAVCFGRDPLTP